jgi:hypothetical protein
MADGTQANGGQGNPEANEMRQACLDFSVPASAHLPASASVQRGGLPRARLYVAASPLHDYYRDVVAIGPADAIEQLGLGAPAGAVLVTDADDGEHGVLVAERKGDDGAWTMTGAMP